MRKLRVGSPSMNMFSSGATSNYINVLSNSNLDTSPSTIIGGSYPSSISSKLHTLSSSKNKIDERRSPDAPEISSIARSTTKNNHVSNEYPPVYNVDLSSNTAQNSNTASSSNASRIPSQPRFYSPIPSSPYLKYNNHLPGVVAEPHDDVMDFKIQDLNATSLSTTSPARSF